MGLAELKTDAAAHRERLSKMKLEGMAPEKFAAVMRLELAENILPLFEGLLDAIDEEVTTQVDDLAAAVDELIDQSEDVLHPETATKIIGVFEVGKLIATELAQLAAKLDDTTKKRLTDLVSVYRQSAEAVAQMVAEITLDPSDGAPNAPASDDQGDDGDDGDGEDEDDDSDQDDEDDDDQEVGHG